MFVVKDLVYLETQKTGGTHIRRLMKRYIGGEAKGKHNRPTVELADKFVFGSIRNPWDWYVSLWAFGVGGKGAVRRRCTSSIDFEYYNRMLPKAMGKKWLTPAEYLLSLYNDLVKPRADWLTAYADSSSPELFRKWLRLLFDKRRRFDVGEGYGFSPLSLHAGLLTYRYFRLLTLGKDVYTDRRLSGYEGLESFDAEKNISSAMIKTESWEEDFVRVMSLAGYVLSAAQVEAIQRKDDGKSNVSERKDTAHYYDEETVDLVAGRDRYIIEKYGYNAPL